MKTKATINRTGLLTNNRILKNLLISHKISQNQYKKMVKYNKIPTKAVKIIIMQYVQQRQKSNNRGIKDNKGIKQQHLNLKIDNTLLSVPIKATLMKTYKLTLNLVDRKIIEELLKIQVTQTTKEDNKLYNHILKDIDTKRK